MLLVRADYKVDFQVQQDLITTNVHDKVHCMGAVKFMFLFFLAAYWTIFHISPQNYVRGSYHHSL